jgi:hypothetical protein
VIRSKIEEEEEMDLRPAQEDKGKVIYLLTYVNNHEMRKIFSQKRVKIHNTTYRYEK